MSYIGFKPVQGNVIVDEFTSSGGSTYTLSSQPTNNNVVEVVVGGLTQSSSAYSFSGTTLTLAGVASGTKIIVRQHGEKLLIPTPGDDTVTGAKIVDNALDSEHYADGSIDTAHIADGAVTAAKIADGTVVAAEIASNAVTTAKIIDDAVTTAKILNANVTTAKIAADAVDGTKIADDALNSEHYAAGSIDLEHMSSQSVDEDNLHISNAGTNGQFLQKQSGNTGGLTWAAVTEYNDASIRADILNLALNQAIADNRVAFNLDNSFVDGFEDDTGITTETDVDRVTSGEYMATIFSGVMTVSSSAGKWSGNTGNVTFSGDDITTTTGDKQIYVTNSISGDFEINCTWNGSSPSGAAFGVFRDNETITGNLDTDNMTNVWYYDRPNNGSGGTYAFGYGQSSQGTYTASNGTAMKIERVGAVIKMYFGGTVRHTYSQQDSGAMKIIFNWSGVTGNSLVDLSWTANTTASSATGTLISDPQTASNSRTSCSGVIMYENETGTATLGTDLKIYFTANNGTNWTEASSYGTATTYSGGTKIVKLGATTVTAGTQVALKGVWANQASGSKVTRLHGWAVNY